jgi:hypothetical protein
MPFCINCGREVNFDEFEEYGGYCFKCDQVEGYIYKSYKLFLRFIIGVIFLIIAFSQIIPFILILIQLNLTIPSLGYLMPTGMALTFSTLLSVYCLKRFKKEQIYQ